MICTQSAARHCPVAQQHVAEFKIVKPCGKQHSPETFLSLYGGVGHLARAVARRGALSIIFDLERDKRNDLSKRGLARDVESLVRRCRLLGFDLPCCTWSRARRAPRHSRFPSAVRSNAFLMGLSDLEPRDQSLVRRHNFMYRETMRLIRLHASLGGSGYLENPATSMLWLTRGVKRLLKLKGFRLLTFDMCQFQCAWKKPTKLLVWGEWSEGLEVPRCSGKAGRCSRTHKPHYTLSGVANGRFRTSAAQVYPEALGEFLAERMLKALSC